MSRIDVLSGKKMTTPYNKPEVNYRKMEGLNYSSIKLYDKDPIKFYNEYVLGNKCDDGPKEFALIIGDLCDFYLLDCDMDSEKFYQRLDEKFVVMGSTKGTGQGFILADEVYKLHMRECDETGEMIEISPAILEEAFNIVQGFKTGKGEQKYFKGKRPKDGAVAFYKDDVQEYYEALKNNRGKTVIDSIMAAKAEKMVNQLRRDEYHGDFINRHTDKDVEVLKKVVVQFEHMGIKCKCEIDFMHIHHWENKIYVRDLKTTFDNEEFSDTYLKQYYYLQNAFYVLGAQSFALEHGLDNYIIEPTAFLVLDTSKYCRRPLLYTTESRHVTDGLNGFYARGRYRKGVNQLMEDLSWSIEENIWDISRENYENRGMVHLKPF